MHEKICKPIAKYFLKFHPDAPLTHLRKCMKESSVDKIQGKIDKNQPIFEFLKNASDTDMKEYTNRLGKKNLRSFISMRSFLGQFFFIMTRTHHQRIFKS